MTSTGGPFRRVARRRVVGCIHAPLAAGADFDTLLDDPDGFMNRGVVLKDDASSRVVRVDLDGTDMVIKRERYPDRLRALRRCLRASRAIRAWRGGLLLERAGFSVASPLGWLEHRRGLIRIGSWGLAGYIAGCDADSVLHAGGTEPIEAIADVVRRLQAAGIVHGDLKASNLRITPADAVCLLDVHAVRCPVAWRRRRALDRERARFLRNWHQFPDLAVAFAAALGDRSP